MGRHFATAFHDEAHPPPEKKLPVYTDAFFAETLEREATTFYRLRHNERHPTYQLVAEIIGALSPAPEELRRNPMRTYASIARKLWAAFYADLSEMGLEKMAKSKVDDSKA